MSDAIPPKERMCHCAWFEKSCRDLVVSGACNRWADVTTTDPRTGFTIAKWDCIDNHAFLLQLKAIQATDQAAAAVESFRNEVVHRYDEPDDRQPRLPIMELKRLA